MTSRIAFVSGDLGFGGASTLLIYLVTELNRRGLAAEIFTFGKTCAFEKDLRLNRLRVTMQDDRSSIFEDRMMSTLIALREYAPSTVVAWLGAESLEVLRYLPAGINRQAVIHCDHEIFYEAIRPYHKVLHTVVAVSNRISEVLRTMVEFRNVSIRAIPNGVPVPENKTLRRPGPLRVLYLGRLERNQKRVHLFPQIARTLIESRIPFEWSIIGEGEERSWLETEMPKSLPGQTIKIIPAIPNQEIPAILRQQDVFLLASSSEGMPMSLLEAMACGVVPVISDLPSGVREVVDHQTGILVSVNDVDAYARGIIHLHEHRDELAAKSAAAHERIKTRFSVAAMTDRWVDDFVFETTAPVQWPKTWRILAPLLARNPLYFSRPVRLLRRLALGFRSKRVISSSAAGSS